MTKSSYSPKEFTFGPSLNLAGPQNFSSLSSLIFKGSCHVPRLTEGLGFADRGVSRSWSPRDILLLEVRG